jgi:curli biogenesis system outer membrane secretion channel CsgG
MNFKLTVIAVALVLAGCDATMPKMGSAQSTTAASGSTAGEASQGANAALEKCASPLGTVALVEETSADWYRLFTTEYRLGSTVPVLRLMIQQSNCFIVVERGRAMANMERERAIAASGQGRAGSNMGGGQMVAADYSMTPEVLVSARGTSGGGAGLGGISRSLGILGAIAGSIKTNEASTMLMLTDNRSGVQISAAQGSSSNTDFSVGAVLFGGGGAGGMGGYTNTPQGKVVIAAFTDSYNQMVKALRQYKPQTVQGQGLGGGGRLGVDGGAAPSQTSAPSAPQPVAAPIAPANKAVPKPVVIIKK